VIEPVIPVEPEAVTPIAPRPVGRTVFTQTWAELTFLHWAVPPAVVAPFMPPGVRPDTFEGFSYVGLVPFLMRGIGALGGPPMPYVGSFCETNVRLYSVDQRGRRGVVFVSLDASRLAPVLAARFGPGLPYLWSRMRVHGNGPLREYVSRRRWPNNARPRGASSRIVVRVGAPVTAGPLESFLTARWGLHHRRAAGPTYYWPNQHGAWPLYEASLDVFDDQLLAAAGFGSLADRPPDSVLFSPGVHATFGPRVPA
jgi:uncharacterized protein YqjF (DUF2071 family)